MPSRSCGWGDVPGVKMSPTAQDIGRTDAHGRFLMPDLNAYFDNELAFAPEAVPIEYEIGATSKKVSP